MKRKEEMKREMEIVCVRERIAQRGQSMCNGKTEVRVLLRVRILLA